MTHLKKIIMKCSSLNTMCFGVGMGGGFLGLNILVKVCIVSSNVINNAVAGCIFAIFTYKKAIPLRVHAKPILSLHQNKG